MGRNYSNKNLTELEIGNIEFYLNEKKFSIVKVNATEIMIDSCSNFCKLKSCNNSYKLL